MKVLVTGATGFVGGHLVQGLLEQKAEVRALIRPGEDGSYLCSLGPVELWEGDVREISSLARAMQGVQRVYHLAARTDLSGTEADYQAINVDGLANVIFTAISTGVQRVIYTSSTMVYGRHLRGTVTEDAPLVAGKDLYSRSKFVGERLVAHLVRDCRAPVVTVRPGWIYGSRDMTNFAYFAAQLQASKPVYQENATSIVPLVHVYDVVQGIIKAGDAGDNTIGQAYTLVHDQRVTHTEYVQAIAEALGIPWRSQHAPLAMPGWIQQLLHWGGKPSAFTAYSTALSGRDFQFSIEHARHDLNYKPSLDLDRGIAECVEWYRTSDLRERSFPATYQFAETLSKQSLERIQKQACV